MLLYGTVFLGEFTDERRLKEWAQVAVPEFHVDSTARPAVREVKGVIAW